MNAGIPPSHLIVFKHSTSDAVKVIKSARKSLGKEQKRRGKVAGAVRYFDPSANHLQDERVYPHLGLAAVHLDPGDVREFLGHPEVFAVVENGTCHALGSLVRRLSKDEVKSGPLDRGISDAVQTFSGGNDPVLPFSGGNNPVRPTFHDVNSIAPYDRSSQGFTMMPYLLGRKDEVESIIRRVEQGEGDAGQARYWPAGQNAPTDRSWCLDMLGIGSGYSKATGKGVKVAVLDTGIDLTHPDFVDRVESRNCLNFIDKHASVQDGHGHGTHCCGVVAGNDKPRCEIRYSVAPGATLLVGKVLDDKGVGKDSDVLDGIAWAANQGARVISLSLGILRARNGPFSPVYAAVARRLLKPPFNCVLVAATGNASHRPQYRAPVANPAASPWVVAVAAVGPDAHIAGFSSAQVDNIGLVSLSAPGIMVLSSYIGGNYAEMSGTSMASAHIAGIAALYQERNPDWTVLNLWPTLVRSALPLGPGGDFGSGLGQVP